jgi:Holliday junction DNA helicase RuvB
MTIIPTNSGKSADNSSSGREEKSAPAQADDSQRAVSEAKARKRSLVLSPQETSADHRSDSALRPQTLQEYIGQSRLKSMLQMSIGAAQGRGESLDHVLFYGPPGLGKTTLAKVIANEMKAKIHMTSGPSLERPRDILGLLHQLEEHDVLFIDEIHRLSRVAEELLYPAIEDFVIDLTSGKGQATRTMRLPLPRFTLVGATTKAGMISNALRDRFGFVCRLDFYTLDELKAIVIRTAAIIRVRMTEEAAAIVAARARGTPRIANRLVRLVRDYGQYQGKELIDEVTACAALESYQVDQYGLDNTDRRFLEILIDNYAGGPVGIETIAATLGEDRDTLEDVYEPFLIQNGFIHRTPRGRVATARAYQHLQRTAPVMQLNLDLSAEVSEEKW